MIALSFLFFNAFTESSLYAFNHANTVDFPTSNFSDMDLALLPLSFSMMAFNPYIYSLLLLVF